MNDAIPMSERAIRLADLFEQIESVNRMIELHTGDAFMQQQYSTLREGFVRELKVHLRFFKLDLRQLAA